MKKHEGLKNRNTVRRWAAVLITLVLLGGSLLPTAMADESYYFPDNGVLLIPATAAPSATPEPSAQPQTTVDGITLSAATADGALAGANFAAVPETDTAVLETVRQAYADAFGADRATPGTALRLYRLRFTRDGEAMAAPQNLTVTAQAPLSGDFSPVVGVAAKAQGDRFAFGDPAAVQKNDTEWAVTAVLADTDLLLLVARAAETAPLATPAPDEYTFADGQISLTASVGGALPPDGAALFADAVAVADAAQPAGETANADEQTPAAEAPLFGYRVGFRTADGELTTDAPLTLRLALLAPDARQAAVAVLDGNGAELWRRGAQEAAPETITFTLPVGGTFTVLGTTAAPQSTETPVPATDAPAADYAFESDALRLTLQVAAGSALPADAQLNAVLYRGDWSAYAAALGAQGVTQSRVGQIVRLTVDFAANGAPVDAGVLNATWNLLLKGNQYAGAESVLWINGDTAVPVSGAGIGADGVTLSLAAGSATEIVLATVLPKQTVFTVENDDARLTVTLPDGNLVPDGAQLTANLTAQPWADVADALTAAGETENRFLQALSVSAGFTLQGAPVDLGETAFAAELYLKRAASAHAVYALANGAAQPVENWQKTDGGAMVAYTATAGETVAFAAALPQSKTYTFENDLLRLSVAVPEEIALPDNAQLDADVSAADWAAFADRLGAHGVLETDALALLNLCAGFTADGAAVDLASTPLSWTVGLKGEQAAAVTGWMLTADAAQPAQTGQPTADGVSLAFTAPAETLTGVAITLRNSAAYTYEDDAYRLTVTVPDAALVPQNAQLNVTLTDGAWADYAHRLQQQGYDETRVQKLVRFTAAFTADGAPVSLTGVPLRYTLLLKGAVLEGSLAYGLLADEAVAADPLTTDTEGATAAFSAADQTDLALAVTLPGRTVYTYEDDQMYVVATLSAPDVIPEGAQLLVTPVEMTPEIQTYIDQYQQQSAEQMLQGGASQQAVQQELARQKTRAYSTYDIRFVQDGQEFEPQNGTVNMAIQYKGGLTSGETPTDVQVLHLGEENGQVDVSKLDASFGKDEQSDRDTVGFTTDGFSLYTVSWETSALKYVLVSTDADTFVNSAYFRDRTLGIAGNFALVGFTSVTIPGSDSYGNILTRQLNIPNAVTIGTEIPYEATYAETYPQVSPNSARTTVSGHIDYSALAVGKDVNVTTDSGTSYFNINGTKIDRPKTVIQDTASKKFIDIAAVSDYADTLASGLKNATATLSLAGSSNNWYIDLNQTGGVGVVNLTPTQIDTVRNSGNRLDFKGFLSNKQDAIIVNVNCTGAGTITLPQTYTHIYNPSTGVTTVTTTQEVHSESGFGTNRVLWNFYNASGVTIDVASATNSSILAPDASVTLNANLNGTVIADVITVKAENHRDDFWGSLPGTTKTSMTATKVWKNADGTDYTGLKPTSITVKLFRSDDTVNAYATGVMTAGTDGVYTVTFTDLPIYSSKGVKYTYTVQETVPSGFTSTTSDVTYPTATTAQIVNKFTQTSVTVNKQWADSATVHPEVTVTLKRQYTGGSVETVTTGTLNSANSWAKTFSALPAGVYVSVSGTPTYKAYTYTVEESVPTGYTGAVVTNSTNNFTLTNTPETTQISVTKQWRGDMGTDAVSGTAYDYSAYRKTDLQLTLKRKYDTTTVDTAFSQSISFTAAQRAGADWSATVTGLSKGFYTVSGGTYTYHAYTYYITEPTVPAGYTLSASTDTTLTNTFQLKRVKVTKAWLDDANRDGTAEAATSGPAVTVRVLDSSNNNAEVDSHTFASGATGTALTWESKLLPAYTAAGAAIAYAVSEDAVTGYISAVGTSSAYANGQQLTVTNTRVRISVPVTKTWNDNGYSGAATLTRPSITYTLYGSDSTTAAATVTLNAGLASYQYTFLNLPKYTVSGTLITYRVEETLNPAGNQAYTVAVNGLAATNTLAVTSVDGAKTWKNPDGTAYTGYKPALTVRLWQTDAASNRVLFTSVSFAANATDYAYHFTGLPRYDANGAAYTYAVDEVAISHFTAAVTATNLQNTLEGTSVTVTKNWDNGDYTGAALTRPSVTVYLFNGADKTTVANNAGSFTFGGVSGNTESHTFTNLPAGYFTAAGVYTPYVYTVYEASPFMGYTLTSTTGSAAAGFTLVNRLNTVSVSVTKNWTLAANGATGTPKVTVLLKRNGTVVDRHTLDASATGGASANWSWTGLPERDPGTGDSYAYTVAEVIDPADESDAPAAGAAAAGFETPVISGNGTSAVTIANQQKTVTIEGDKVWKDADGATYPAGAHTPAFTITLYRSAYPYTAAEAVPGVNPVNFAKDAASLHYAFASLPQLDLAGREYRYSVVESAVAGFATTYPADTNNVQNTLASLQVTVTKAWADGSAARPVTVSLLRKAQGATDWENVPGQSDVPFTGSKTFTGLPAGVVDATGTYRPYAYTVTETPVDGYTTGIAVTGEPGADQTVTVTNTRITTSFTATKQWRNAADTQTVTAPAGATVTLQLMRAEGTGLAQAVANATVVLDGTADSAPIADAYESAAWTALFTNLPATTEAGVSYHYSVTETAATGADGFRTVYAAGSDTAATVKNLQTLVTVQKQSAVDNAALDGATFTLTNTQNTSETYTLTGSGASGAWTRQGVLKPDVAYRLTETTPPVGYLPAEPVYFRISSADGNVYTKDASGNYTVLCDNHAVVVVDQPIDLKLIKINAGAATLTLAQQQALPQSAYVTGATLTLVRKNQPDDHPQTLAVTATGLVLPDSSHLVYGETYVLTETVTPNGYLTAAPVEITLGDTVNTLVYTMVDTAVNQKTFEVQKTWVDGTPGRNVTFVLTRNGVEVDRAVLETTDADQIIAFANPQPVTDENGNAYTYAVDELAVDGYTVTEAMHVVSDADGVTRYGITNAPIVLTVDKQSLTAGGAPLAGSIPGAVLRITDNAAPQTTVEEWTTDGTAHAVSGKLLAGHTYTLTEITPPMGYAPAASIQFTLSAAGAVAAVGDVPADATLTPGTTGGAITLRDRQLTLSVSKQAAGGGAELPGATLTLADTTDGKTVASWTGGNAPKVLQSTAAATDSGAAVKIGDAYYTFADGQQYPLIAGHTYTLTEDAAPAGYLLTNAITFTLNADHTVTLGEINGTAAASGSTVTLFDELNSFTITKQNTDGDALAGAEFALYLYSETAADHLGEQVYPASAPAPQTDSQGKLTVRGLTNGAKYVLVETKAPDGYTVAEPTTFTYQDGQATGTQPGATVVDAAAWMKLRKVGPDQTPVAGSTLSIYNQDKTKKWTFVSVAGSEANPDGWLTVYADAGQTDAANYLVKGGQYWLLEEAAPDGYELRTDYVAFTFGQGDGQALSFMDKQLELLISKKAITGGEEIAGAALRITDDTDSGRPVDSWTSEAGVTHTVPFASLRAGHTYTLTETTAPAGYMVAESIRFTIANDGSVSLVTGSEGEVSGHTVTMRDDYNTLTVDKRGVGNAKLTQGVGFTLYQSDANGAQGAQVGTEGVLFRGLANGYYLLRETTVPAGYVVMEPLLFQFAVDSQTGATTVTYTGRTDTTHTTANGAATLIILDAPTLVRVTKVDLVGNAVAGASLSVYTDNGNAPGAQVPGTAFTTQADDPATTGVNEAVHEYAGLLTAGLQYWLVEDAVPEGSGFATAAPVPFTVGDTASAVAVRMVNQTLQLSLWKLDSDATDPDTGAYTGNKLTGPVLTLTGPYQLGSVTEQTHTWTLNTVSANPAVLTLADGLVPGGEYTLSEDPATVPDGYLLAPTQTFTLPLYGAALTRAIVDAPAGTVSVTVRKAWRNAADTRDLTTAELPGGLTVRVYLHRALADGSGAADLGYYDLTAAEGWAHTFSGALPATDAQNRPYVYTVTEDAVPGFTLAGIGGDADTGANFDYTIRNAAQEATFSKRALSVGGDELPGALMQVLDATPERNVLAQWVSGDAPHTLYGVLTPGSYVLHEVAAPGGYTVTTDIPFTLDANMQPTVGAITYGGTDGGIVYMVDGLTTVTLSKQAAGGGPELQGAHLTVTHTGENGQAVTDAAWVSGQAEDGAYRDLPYTLTGLTAGVVYTFTEETAPNGYLTAERIQFVIQPDGTVKAKPYGAEDSAYQLVTGQTVIMLDAPTTVLISKQAAGAGAELQGASLSVTHQGENGATVTDAQWVSGQDDTGAYADVPHTIKTLTVNEIYTLTETTAPYGYTVAERIQFRILENGEVQAKPYGQPDSAFTTVGENTVLMLDQPTRALFSKKTLAANSPEQIGAYFTVTDLTPQDGQPQTEWTWVSDGAPHEILGGLIGGHTYQLTETTPPAGYVAANPVTFTVSAAGALAATDATGAAVDNSPATVDAASATITVRNAPTVLTIAKVDDQTPPQIVKNATLTVYAATGADATVPGAVVTTVSTGETGTATVTGTLVMGRWYMVGEVTAPDGYLTAQTSAPFQLAADGTAQVGMTDARTLFRVAKKDANTGALLAGATIAIYDSTLVDGALQPDLTAQVASVVTVAGELAEIRGLKLNHTYYLYEAGAPDGYIRNRDLYTAFTINPDGSTAVYSVDKPTRVLFDKVDGNGDRVGGASLALVTGTDTVYTEAELIARWTSSATEPYAVEHLLIGQPYTLLETEAPAGYTLNTAGVTFMLNEDGMVIPANGSVTDASAVQLVTLLNSGIRVTFSKQATGAGTAELPGATLTITHSGAQGTVEDARWVSGDAQHRDGDGNPVPHVMTGGLLADGTTEYTFTEVGAPDGYTIAGSLVFRVETDGSVSVRQANGSWATAADNNVIMTDAPIRFRVAKVDVVTAAYLPGAKFTVVADVNGAPDPSGTPVLGNITSGAAPVTLSGLPKGSYWLVETQAPVGTDVNGQPVYYQLAAPAPFTLTDELLAVSELVTVTVADTPSTVTVYKLDSNLLNASGDPAGNRVPGATLTLTRKSDGLLIDTHTFTADADWTLDAGQLQPGVTYTLTETPEHTPDGYLSAGSVDFTVAADGNDRWIVVDDPIDTRSITVNKQWKDSLTTHPQVTLNLYRSDDPTRPYRTATLGAGDTSITFTNLPTQNKDHTAYTYTVQEITVPGYLPGVFTGPAEGTDSAVYTYTLRNTPTAFTAQKLAADTGKPLAGAQLRLVKGDGTAYTDADVVDTWVSGTDGTNADGTYKPHPLTGKLAVGGQYTLLELAAPAGYLTASSVTFTVQTNGTASVTGTGDLTLTDQPVTVRFAKLDNLTGLPVAGAIFAVYDDAQWQSSPTTAVPVVTFTSATQPVEIRGVFTAGTLYRLVETAAPAGYQVNAASVQFAAPTTSGVLTISMDDARIYRFAKVDSVTGKAVSGAKLRVTDEAGNTVIDEWTSGTTPFEFANTDLTGAPVLKAGIAYLLVERVAPNGYQLNSTPVRFTLDDAGLISGGVTVTLKNTPNETPVEETIDLTIRKTWSDNDNAGNTRPTGGLSVTVYRKLSTETNYTAYLTVTVPYRTGNSWYLTLRGLDRYNAGGVEYNYRAREVVPAGYTVTYANNGFTMVNTYPTNEESPTPTPIPTLTPTPGPSATRVPTSVKYVDGQWVYIDENEVPLGIVPQTGDETSWLAWGAAILLPLLLAMFAGVLLYRRRRKNAASR